MARLCASDTRFQRQNFVLPDRDEPWYLPRDPVEASLVDFIERTLDRVPAGLGVELREAWERNRQSAADADEARWCRAAGRLGLDPYDPETPDFDVLAGSLSPDLFADLSEAATIEELPAARAWIEAQQDAIRRAPRIAIGHLGAFPHSDADDHPAHFGQVAATRVHQAVGRTDPSVVFREVIGGGDRAADRGPAIVQGLTHRADGTMSAVVQGNGPYAEQQRRFRMWHAVFVAWGGQGRRRRVGQYRKDAASSGRPCLRGRTDGPDGVAAGPHR